MKIINVIEIETFESEKRRDRHINNFSSGYLALGYMLLIGFICILGGSLIELIEVLS